MESLTQNKIMDEETLKIEYKKLLPILNHWGDYVDKRINDLKKKLPSIERIQIHNQYRVKEIDSFISKALYRNNGCDKPLNSITDKVGTRIVLLTLEDVDNFSSYINNEKQWEVLKITRIIHDERRKNPELFGYQSNHFIIKPNSFDDVITKENIDYLTCEIQVRTLLQHAYAEVSHDSVYKGNFSSDFEMKRTLARSMALMETTDDLFLTVFGMMNNQNRDYIKFKHKLVDLYQQVNSDFKSINLDEKMTDEFLYTFPLNQDTILIDEFEQYVSNKDHVIKNAVNNRKLMIFKQPILLYAMYLLDKHTFYAIDNWPFNSDSLSEIKSALNISCQY